MKPHKHPVNQAHHEQATAGERLADQIAAGIGSWRFLVIQTIAVIAWVAVNLIGFARRWDPFPFILLNLLFSVQAAYTGPVLLLAGNRQSQKDRRTLEQTYEDSEALLKKIDSNTALTLRIAKHLEVELEA